MKQLYTVEKILNSYTDAIVLDLQYFFSTVTNTQTLTMSEFRGHDCSHSHISDDQKLQSQ